jgi:hypothetical protein
MTTGLSFNGTPNTGANYITQIATMAVVDTTDPNFLNILPAMITYAENRIYRELDFLFSSISTTAYTLTTGNRQLSVPAGTFVVPEQINVLLPLGVTDPNAATRYPLLATTKEFLDAAYGDYTNLAMPKYFCPFDDYLFYVGPFPDQNYTVEIVGTYRPQSFGPSNTDTTFLTNYQTYTGTAYPNYANTTTTTFISLYLPELFIMASMIYISAYQRNFSSAMGNDPQMPITYETQYQALLKSALEEENRKKFEAAAWSSQGASKFATPTRG